MFMKHPTFVAALMLGVSTVVLHAQDLPGSTESAAQPAPLFGAPAAPVGATPASIVGVQKPTSTQGTRAWVLDRPKPEAADTGAAEASNPTIDLSALRYYARENDLARVAAEIRLLRAKHPGWEPPDDLFTEAKGGEAEQPLWDLFAKHDLTGLKAAIEERRQQTPGWQPSSDLAGKLAMTEAFDSLVAASDAKAWGTVLDIASTNGALLTCANIDAIWRTAEALIATGDETHAVEAYRYVLATCAKPEDRLSTVQKAAVLLQGPDALDGLIRMGRRLPDGRTEFEEIRFDGVRRKVGDTAAGKAGPSPTAAEIEQLTARARTPAGRADAELLGWYAVAQKDFAGAETWFRTSLQAGPSPKGAEGLVIALRGAGKAAEASRLALQYADLGPLNRKLMVEVLTGNLADPQSAPLTPDQTAVLTAAIDAEHAADGAQAYGWTRYKANDLAAADAWFHKSAAWQPNESAAIGLLVTAQRLNHASDYAAVLAQYRGTYPRVAAMGAMLTARPARVARRGHAVHVARGPKGNGWDESATAIVKTFEGGQYDQAIAMLDERKGARRGEPGGLSVVRGWAMYKKGDWEGARHVFTDAGGKGMTEEAMQGVRVIDRGYLPPHLR